MSEKTNRPKKNTFVVFFKGLSQNSQSFDSAEHPQAVASFLSHESENLPYFTWIWESKDNGMRSAVYQNDFIYSNAIS